ncbi:hypothetical protein QBC40DRAFT_255233 [Triangularia verruculosa]|uniref:F-box domain-containing protein n=1 Tax=Triangularia verruculosa TaxID=2587418 RepID=A0AAN7ATZ5_9PEZI|nr:hypothetical protein QBC40DRAFT_255233 [Triangularia verruculosa]
MTSTRPTPNLATLPLDILFELSTHLDYGDILLLKQTCRSLHSSLDPDSLLSHSAKLDFYQRVERFSRYRAHLTCFKCFRLLPARESFIDTHRTGPRGKYEKGFGRKSQRACCDCIILHKLLPQGTGAFKEGLRWYLCHRCKSWKLCTQRCRKVHKLPEPQGPYPATSKEYIKADNKLREMIHARNNRKNNRSSTPVEQPPGPAGPQPAALQRATHPISPSTRPKKTSLYTWYLCGFRNTATRLPDRLLHNDNLPLRISKFENLPLPIHKLILSQLDYPTLISLSSASNYLRLLLPDPALACSSIYFLQSFTWRRCHYPPLPDSYPVAPRRTSLNREFIPCPGCWRPRNFYHGFPKQPQSHGLDEDRRDKLEKCRWCGFFKDRDAKEGEECDGCLDNPWAVDLAKKRLAKKERLRVKKEMKVARRAGSKTGGKRTWEVVGDEGLLRLLSERGIAREVAGDGEWGLAAMEGWEGAGREEGGEL